MKRFLKWGGIVIVAGSLLTAGILVKASAINRPGAKRDRRQPNRQNSVCSRCDRSSQCFWQYRFGGDRLCCDGCGRHGQSGERQGWRNGQSWRNALITLNTVELERAVRKAELNVAAAKNSLAQLQEPASATEIVAAEAELLSAQKKLEDAQKPASSDEVSAAKANVNSAWSKYNELLAPITRPKPPSSKQAYAKPRSHWLKSSGRMTKLNGATMLA